MIPLLERSLTWSMRRPVRADRRGATESVSADQGYKIIHVDIDNACTDIPALFNADSAGVISPIYLNSQT